MVVQVVHCTKVPVEGVRVAAGILLGFSLLSCATWYRVSLTWRMHLLLRCTDVP